jgi:hypothetical protein
MVVFLRAHQFQRWVNIDPWGPCGKATVVSLDARYVMIRLKGRHCPRSESVLEQVVQFQVLQIVNSSGRKDNLVENAGENPANV